MKLLISLLFTMSVSGTIALLFYKSICFLGDKYIAASSRYFLLKLCLLFYLFPFPLIKHGVYTVWILPYVDLPAQNGEIFLDTANSLILSDRGFVLKSFTIIHQRMVTVWILILFGLLLRQIYRNIRLQKNAVLYSEKLPASLSAVLCTFRIVPDSVPIYYCTENISPFTCGVLHPAIVLSPLVNKENAELILRHEVQHIKSHDIFYKLLAKLVFYIHILNPIVFFFLLKEIMEVQEMNCDEQLMKKLTAQEQAKYGHILLETTNAIQPSQAPAFFFSRTKHSFLKKRMEKIYSFPPRRTFPACLLAVFLCVTASIPTAAYSPATIDVRDNPLLDESVSRENGDWVILDLSSDALQPHIEEDEMFLQYYDEILLLEDGSVVPLPSGGITPYQSSCTHTYVTGTKKEHLKNGSGCTVTTYEVKVCSKCRYIQSKTSISTITYKPCPH